MEISQLILQLCFNMIIAGGIYALTATGYSVIQATLKFINFQHAQMCVLGAYVAYFVSEQLGLGLLLGCAVAIPSVAFLGVIIEKVGYKPLRNAPSMSPMITSLGFSIVILNSVTLIWGPWVKAYSLPSMHNISVFGAIITIPQLATIILAIGALFILHFFIKDTKLGKAMRAVADNRDYAALMGIDVDRVVSSLFALSSGLAAMTGILIGIEGILTPVMGTALLVRVFAASIIGGLGNISGAIIGSFVIAGVEVLGIWFYSPAYATAYAFIILIAVMLLRPGGFFGEK
jgi:branched-subunit amino acid ABC-type transport system permease component